ncbi:hypothetical protein M5E89_10935 [Acidaminococcus intestini]|nr:hypothetical protein M5E89_10935 [Acidaminococcus intestini]
MGHPWVFEGEVLKESEKPENGSLVDVVSEKGKYIGTGFYNDHSKIRVRLLSYNANDRFDEAFLSAAFGMPWTIARPLCPVRILPAAA